MKAEGEDLPTKQVDAPERTLEDVHRDVALANQYRLEFIKHTMSLSAAVFVFTATFWKDFVPATGAWRIELLGLGWGCMVFSLIGGLFHMFGWDRYYISYRDWWRKDASQAKAARASITTWRRLAMILQFVGFSIGLVLIAVFCLGNLPT